MTNPRHLSSLLAIAEHGSFSAAGAATGRSHSAISLHIKALEDDLKTVLVVRGSRPASLTRDGEELAEHARRLLGVLDDIQSIGRSDVLTGRLAIGFVPTAMARVAPPALARLRAQHPGLEIEIRTGLSGELAYAVRANELDGAVLTAPDLPPEDLISRPVADEPLVVIAPEELSDLNDARLLGSYPFIWFSRKTWAGQQIERRLLDRRIRVRAAMEVDSLEAIEALVKHGLGVSIVPDTNARGDGLVRRPFGVPQAIRQLVLISRQSGPKARLLDALHTALTTGGSGKLPHERLYESRK